VFALGRSLPTTAQVARQQAVFLARSLVGYLRQNRPLAEFHFRDMGSLVSLADYAAYGTLGASSPTQRRAAAPGPAQRARTIRVTISGNLIVGRQSRTTRKSTRKGNHKSIRRKNSRKNTRRAHTAAIATSSASCKWKQRLGSRSLGEGQADVRSSASYARSDGARVSWARLYFSCSTFGAEFQYQPRILLDKTWPSYAVWEAAIKREPKVWTSLFGSRL
jgi:hypothetical protein